MSQSTQKPLTTDEIETLLRAARERQHSVRSDVVSREPLGPGDVQHLQNTAFAEGAMDESEDADALAEFVWPRDSLNADQRLQQAEQQLADALSSRDDSFVTTDVATTDGTTNTVGQSFPFTAFDAAPSGSVANGVSLESLGDIELDVSLELGRAEVTIEELLQLREGSVVSLDKTAGEPIDILANGCLVARGEVIVIEGKFGVRVCEVIAQR